MEINFENKHIMHFVKQKGKGMISFTLILTLLISLFNILSLSAYAAEVGSTFTVDGVTYSVLDDSSVGITKYSNTNGSTNIEIPAQVENESVNYNVTRLIGTMSASAFDSDKNIEEIHFPESLTTVDKWAFYQCTTLKTVYINSDVQFAEQSFYGCTALKDIYCNSDKIVFDDTTFKATGSTLNTDLVFYGKSGCSAEDFVRQNATTYHYTFVSTGGDVEEDDTIFVWKKLNEEDGEDGPVEIVGFKAGNEKTMEVVIPSVINKHPVTAIGESAFKDNQSITKLTIPESVTTIKDKAFYNMSYLKEVTFAENSKLETIEANAFAVSPGAGTTDRMGTIDLPVSLKSIGDKAFANRRALSTVRIFSNDVTFGEDVFTILGAEKNTVKIYGYEGSSTETYAEENSLTFRYLYPESENLPENLKNLYDQAKAINKSLYTNESYEVLSKVMDTAKKLTGSGKLDAKPDEIRQCIADLQAAIDGLVLAPTEATTTAATEATTAASETTVAAEPTEATTAAPETTTPVQTVEVLLGDADSSGKIDVKDVTHIQKHIASYFTLEGTPALAADVDGNGTIDVNDATLIQKYLASYNVDYKIGEVVQFGSDTPAPTAENPQPTEVQPTTAAVQPTDSPEPTTAAATDEPEPSKGIDPPQGEITFYVPNYVDWLDNDGCKLWIYNEDTDEVRVAKEYNSNDEGIVGYFYFYIPENWVNLSIYRTAYNIEKDAFDRTSKYDETTNPGGIVINQWEKIGDRGENIAYRITADGKGEYDTFNPQEPKPDETERTIYFDNRQTQWTGVYIYGWAFGLSEEPLEMELVGDNIWAYTFYDELPIDKTEGFIFVNSGGVVKGDSGSWSNVKQTVDLATEAGKNLFVPTPGNGKLSGTWDVYTP